MFGNIYSNRRYADTLSRLHPHALFFDPWAKTYEVFSGPLKPEVINRQNSDVILVGSEDLGHDGAGGAFPVPPGGRLREVLRTGVGGVYRVERE
jgi:hypothetical protein